MLTIAFHELAGNVSCVPPSLWPSAIPLQCAAHILLPLSGARNGSIAFPPVVRALQAVAEVLQHTHEVFAKGVKLRQQIP